MGIVKYKKQLYRDVASVVLKDGKVQLHKDTGEIEIINLNLTERSRVQIKHEGVKGMNGACCIESLHSNNCVLINGNVENVVADNMIEVAGVVSSIRQSDSRICNRGELNQKYWQLVRCMEKGFEQEEKRKILHLYGYFNLVVVEQIGSVEVWIDNCNVKNCVVQNSANIRGNVDVAKAGNKILYSTIKERNWRLWGQ